MPIVSYDIDDMPEVPEKERKQLSAMSDEEIDYSDIPEAHDFSGFTRAGYRSATRNRTEFIHNCNSQDCNPVV
jgi:hypothetical protein